MIYKIAVLVFAIIVIGYGYGYIDKYYLKKDSKAIKAGNYLPEGDLNGEIFIATKGGHVFRLALVEVRIIPKETFFEFSKIRAEETKKEIEMLAMNAKIIESKMSAEKDPLKNLHLSLEMIPINVKIKHHNTWIPYFTGVPEGLLKTKTNSDGKFTLRIKRDVPVVVFAHGSREVGSETENYFWTIPVKLEGEGAKNISLNNDNLFPTVNVTNKDY